MRSDTGSTESARAMLCNESAGPGSIAAITDGENTSSDQARPESETTGPRRTGDLRGGVGSERRQSKVGIDKSSLAKLCTGRAGPSSARSGASRSRSHCACPKIGKARPVCVDARVGKANPMCKKSKTDKAKPVQAGLLIRVEEPRRARSRANGRKPGRPVAKGREEGPSVTRLRAGGVGP